LLSILGSFGGDTDDSFQVKDQPMDNSDEDMQ